MTLNDNFFDEHLKDDLNEHVNGDTHMTVSVTTLTSSTTTRMKTPTWLGDGDGSSVYPSTEHLVDRL